MPQKRGFNIMSMAQRIAIAKLGGRATAKKGSKYMGKIGRKGGLASGQNKLERRSKASKTAKKAKP